MSSTNKTKNLGLSQWVPSDRPMRNDFNNDNATVDSVLGGHVNNSDIHITAEEKKYLTDSCYVYMYSGTGEESRTFNLTDTIKFITVFAKDKPISSSKVYSAFGYIGLGASSGLSVSSSGTGFTVKQGNDENGNTLCLNESGVQYRAVIFK